MAKDDQGKKNWNETTIAVRAGLESDESYNSVMPPLYMSTNYAFSSFGEVPVYDYGRVGNPTRDVVGKALADMEGGFNGVMTSSGMAALDLMFTHLDPADIIVAPHDCYGGTYRLLRSKAAKGHYKVNFIDQTDDAALKAAFEAKPKMILLETPSNPLLRIVDIEKVVAMAKKTETLVVVDNTFLSPFLQKPFDFGVDAVIHSTTKYINGHSDVIGGCLITKDEELYTDMRWWNNCIGYAPSPFDCYLTLRGVRTLNARMSRQQETAAKLVDYLCSHESVEKVFYPGLESHAGYEIAKRQQKGAGAMISFELKGGEKSVRSFVNNLDVFSLAESLGGVESLIAHPATMTHRGMGPEALVEAGISHGLLRISTGQEDAQDLIDALVCALDSTLSNAA